MEIAETPNGKVFCHKKLKSLTVKFELQNAGSRTFALFRMCHISAMVEWMYLDSGTLDELAQRIMPTLETDEFFKIL